MNFLKLKKELNIFTNLKFAIFVLILITISSSIGSFIEQDESFHFYAEKYPLTKPIYGFISVNLIIKLGIDHLYRTWWFIFLIFLLGFCLICCTITRQFPLFLSSKSYLFKQKKKVYKKLPFFVKIRNISFNKELLLHKSNSLNFYIYQKKNFVYAYKGLIGRVSPIFVHLSLIIILVGSLIGAFKNFKVQEVLPKGEFFNIQNIVSTGGWATMLPKVNARVNDFWVDYENVKVHQFYSNISILDNYGNELKRQTISVNNPLRYKGIDFYQSDWNLLGIRMLKKNENKIYEFPLFPLKKGAKAWVTWVENLDKNYSVIFNQLQNNFILYDKLGIFLGKKNIGDTVLDENYVILEIVPSTGLLIKHDPSTPIIYCGFGLLMLTTLFSYLPYTQIWVLCKKKYTFLGGLTNRGEIQLEIEFENLIRYVEKNLNKNKLNRLNKKKDYAY